MNQEDTIGNAIYVSVMERLLSKLIDDLHSNADTDYKPYHLKKKIYNELDEEHKAYFIEYIKSILDDCACTVLAGLEGETDIDLYPCDDIEILCDNKKVRPFLTDVFKGLIEQNNLYK